MLSIENIRSKKFRKKFLGYSIKEVDKFTKDVSSLLFTQERDLKNTYKNLEKKTSELEDAKRSIHELIEKAQRIEEAIKDQDDVNRNLKEEKQSLFSRLEKSLTQMKILKSEKEEIESSIDLLKEDVAKLENEILKLKNEKEQAEMIASQLKDERSQMNEVIESSIEPLKKDVAKLENEILKLKNEKEQAEMMASKLRDEKKHMQEEIETLHTNNNVYKENENSIKDAIITANKIANEIIQNAEKSANMLRSNAMEDIQKLREDVENEMQNVFNKKFIEAEHMLANAVKEKNSMLEKSATPEKVLVKFKNHLLEIINCYKKLFDDDFEETFKVIQNIQSDHEQ